MYRTGTLTCVSFGRTKPLEIGRGGAILLDDPTAYKVMLAQRYDGRDLGITPWQAQEVFHVGYHYKPTTEEAELGSQLLPTVTESPKFVQYPDCRKIKIINKAVDNDLNNCYNSKDRSSSTLITRRIIN
jgi:hypothetical protein